MDVYTRFRLEPRGEYGRRSRAYLVVFDKETKAYVKDPNDPKRYMRFADSDIAFGFLSLALSLKDNTDTCETP